jgi:hypothetical protein
METTLKNYRVYLFTYGILSVLFALQYFEDLEDYDECQKIIDAIREQEERLNIKLFTVINKETISEVIEGYKPFGLTGINAIENSKYYSELIIKEVLTNK